MSYINDDPRFSVLVYRFLVLRCLVVKWKFRMFGLWVFSRYYIYGLYLVKIMVGDKEYAVCVVQHWCTGMRNIEKHSQARKRECYREDKQGR